MTKDPKRDPMQAEAPSSRGDFEPRRRYVDDPLQALTAFEVGGPPPEILLEQLDLDALKVVHRLRAYGHQAYLVGGCVRDLLLGLKPKDFDVATSAHPGEIRAIFRNCRLIGRRFRLAHVYFRGGKVIETATFRANPNEAPAGESAEAPTADLLITADNVFGTAEQDARRRDFTVNGLFYDVILGRVLDYVGGREDLEKRQIRTIGDPDVRFQEDPVRILRAVRFAAKAGLEIEAGTWAAMMRHKEEIARCAPPRVLEEIFKLLRSGHARRCIELLHELRGLEVLLPPLAAFLKQARPERASALFTSLGLLDEVVRRGPLPDDSVLLSTLLVHLSQHELIKGRQETATGAAAIESNGPIGNVDTYSASVGSAEDTSGASEVDAGEDDLDRLEEMEEESDETSPLPPEPTDGEAPVVPWSISASARTVDELLAELVRTARLPRRIAERARLLLHAQRVLSGARKRRGSPLKFVRQNIFPDAMLVYGLYVEATGHGAESLARWRERYAETVAESGGVPLATVAADEGAASTEGAGGEAGSEGSERRRRGRRRGKGRGRSNEVVEASEDAGEPTPILAEAVSNPAPAPARRHEKERLPPEAERGPPPGPADLLPF